MTTSTDIDIRLVDLDDTFELRKAVLRPWLTLEDSRELYSSVGEHFHVGALIGKRVVSTAAFMIDVHPDYMSEFGALQWRLRGMASDPALQGQGLGGRVLEFGVDEVARRLGVAGHSSAAVWCSGRTGAQRFYERHGFAPIGELYETPGTGPHYVFWRKVAAA
ncbi:MAG: GNAT family N-acetyltransferase [Kiloniellaceae bacterium]